MNEPTEGMACWQSNKRVLAGRITELTDAGCYVANKDGTVVFRTYPENMTARYQPVVGDVWIVYPDGYQSLSPATSFYGGYEYIGPGKAPTP